MRRSYISPEFKYVFRPGTMNMYEKSSFFGSKMMDIEDSLIVDNRNIIYYQNADSEQLNLELEKNNLPNIYNTLEDKRSNHTLSIDQSQSDQQIQSNTRWLLSIDLRSILSNLLYAKLKEARTFEGVKNISTVYNNVDDSIREYVNNNLVSRYEFTNLQFYVEYVALSDQGRLRYNNNFREISTISNITTKIAATTNFNKSRLDIVFNQELSSETHCFDYYFSLQYLKV